TSGCPGCNRPYYNERPGGPLYNYPRQPLPDEIRAIKEHQI
ncbi:MAG: radical SAM protein, partial [Candidatus Bathyarchaeota archaeon]|nr:radical SAM protein [Candidatus Bathyarchaeota archaeon]